MTDQQIFEWLETRLTTDEIVQLGACIGEVSDGHKDRLCNECSSVISKALHGVFFK